MKNMIKDIIIAIDGHSGCGKSSTAKALAKHFKYKYLDSGAMYRAVTLFFLRNKVDINDIGKVRDSLEKISIDFVIKSGIQKTFLNGKCVEDIIRKENISKKVSVVSAIPEVRKFLVNIQKKMGLNKKIVVEGRDITTVVFPNAEIKVFMTASLEVRARRRYEEMKISNPDITLDQISDNLKNRDEKDSNREDSPLLKVDDAYYVDTSSLKLDDQIEKIKTLVYEKFG
jgi:cytidylate kinase